MKYALATLKLEGVATPAIVVDGRHYKLAEIAPDLLRPVPSNGLMNLLRDWDESERKLARLASFIAGSSKGEVTAELSPESFLAPLLHPNKLMLGGANYYEHMRVEANKPDFQKETATPVFFLKPPSTSLVGGGKSVRYPSQSTQFDWEIELAVVVGRHLKRATLQEAANAIAAYAVGIDLSARDWQMNQKHPWKFDLFTGKAFDDSCPMGPLLVPSRFVNERDLRLQLWVNGVLMQDAHTDDMIWSAAEQLAAISEHLTIEAGDVLLTGTPAGVGMARQEFLNVGDRIEAEITGLGRLHVEILPDGKEKPVKFET